jgi:predicted RNA-binding protein with PUA domain
MTTQIEGDFRGTPEYEQAKLLVTEKKQLQARLSEVNKLLRSLDLFRPGIVGFSRKDLERD